MKHNKMPNLSYSTLKWLGTCSLACWHKLKGHPPEIPHSVDAGIGTYWHRRIKAALLSGEKYLLVDDARQKVQISIGWLLGDTDPNLILLEQKIEAPVGHEGEYTLTIIPDFIKPGVMVDFKFGWQEITENNIPPAYRLQADIYLYVLLSQPGWERYVIGGGVGYHIFNGRYGTYPWVCSRTYSDLPQLEELIIDLCQEAEQLFSLSTPPKPTPGDCRFCDYPLSCPVGKASKIVTQEDAVWAAQQWIKGEMAQEARRKLLESWVAEHGNILIGDQEVGWRKSTKTTCDLQALIGWIGKECKCKERTCITRAQEVMRPDITHLKQLARRNDDIANLLLSMPDAGQSRWGVWNKTNGTDVQEKQNETS